MFMAWGRERDETFHQLTMGVLGGFVVTGETNKTTMLIRNLITLVSLALIALPCTSVAQSAGDPPMRTLLGGDSTLHHGGWGAPSAHYTRIMDQDAMLVGLRGGWIINHRFTLGFAGHGLVTDVVNKDYDNYLIDNGTVIRDNSRFFMGYGGLLLEPVIAYRSPLHITLPIIIGAGGCGYGYNSELPDDFDPYTYSDDAQAFFVIEPGIELEMNVISLVRVGIGASYRYTSDIDLPTTAKDALHGLNAGVTIKVGRF